MANSIWGWKGWATQIVKVIQNQLEYKEAEKKYSAIYMVIVRINIQNGASREDVGVGESTRQKLCDAVDAASKSAVSDAIKRALR